MHAQHNNTPEHPEQNAEPHLLPEHNASRDLSERDEQDEACGPRERRTAPVLAFTPLGRRPVRRAPLRIMSRQGAQRARHILARHGQRLAGSALRRRGLRLKRRVYWGALVMISRRRTVVFPLLGPLSLNGVRIWIVCAALAVWGLARV